MIQKMIQIQQKKSEELKNILSVFCEYINKGATYREKLEESETNLRIQETENNIIVKKIDTFIHFLNNLEKCEETQGIVNEITKVSETLCNSQKTKELKEKYIKDKRIYIEYLKNLKLISFKNTSLCTICLTNQVDCYINDCGHTLCNKCYQEKDRFVGCHICRKPIISVNKLYYS